MEEDKLSTPVKDVAKRATQTTADICNFMVGVVCPCVQSKKIKQRNGTKRFEIGSVLQSDSYSSVSLVCRTKQEFFLLPDRDRNCAVAATTRSSTHTEIREHFDGDLLRGDGGFQRSYVILYVRYLFWDTRERGANVVTCA